VIGNALVRAQRCAISLDRENCGGSTMREVSLALVFWTMAMPPLAAEPAHWRLEWPDTDFTRHAVALDEIVSGGPPRDGIPAIDDPRFVPVAEAGLPDREP
jgi:hypothetical protein